MDTSYADLLEENEVDLSAPLDAFDSGMQLEVEAQVDERGDDYNEVEVVGVEVILLLAMVVGVEVVLVPGMVVVEVLSREVVVVKLSAMDVVLEVCPRGNNICIIIFPYS